MKCKEIQNLIPLYLKGMLTEKEQKEVLQHIETCSECKKTLELEIEITKGIEDFFIEEYEGISPVNYSFIEHKQNTEQKKYNLNTFKKLTFAFAATILIAFMLFLFNKNRQLTIREPEIKCVQISKPKIQNIVFIDGKLKTKVNKVGENIYLIQIKGGQND